MTAMSPTSCSTSDRLAAIDIWRGVACLCMIAYHLAFDLCQFGFWRWEAFESTPMWLFERFIAWSFILCAGIGCRFSRSSIRRGLICAGAGLVVVAASFIVSAPIRFGVLQLLSAGMLLYGLVGRHLRWDRPATPVLCLVLYALTAWWTGRVEVGVRWLYWLGFRYDGFVSYDYFPLLPYLFLFALGVWLGEYIRAHRDARWLHVSGGKALVWMGRHTLLIYLVHQPVLYAAFALLY